MRHSTSASTPISYDNKRSDRLLPTPYRLRRPCASETNVLKAAPIACPKLYEGGLWLELKHPGPMQAFQATLYDEEGKMKVQRQFVITSGSNTFFWNFDNANWPAGMYTLRLRDRFCHYEWKLPL